MKKSSLINSTILGIVAAGVVATSAHAVPNQPTAWEKCAGVAKKGMNDCGSFDGKHGCHGQSKISNSDVEWVYVPKGTCAKLTGGVVKATKPAK